MGLIGSGNMAAAMVAGWARADPEFAKEIVLTDHGSGRAAALAQQHGCQVAANNRELAEQCDAVILCVKPIDIENVIREITDLIGKNMVVASVAAGVQTATIENLLERGVSVLRFMPNVPVCVNAGTLVCARGRVRGETSDQVIDAFALLGTVVHLEERLFDAATALSGSGPAFMGLVIEAFEDAAIVSGLSSATAKTLALTTMYGTAELLMVSGMTCPDLRRMVTSPGGTAAAGLAHLERSGVRGAIIDAVVAARDRAAQLG